MKPGDERSISVLKLMNTPNTTCFSHRVYKNDELMLE